ncbi:MAG: hypothetical protein ACI8UO_003616 [Verrucomicrobiales bacterium]|jgi:hypothetical protein
MEGLASPKIPKPDGIHSKITLGCLELKTMNPRTLSHSATLAICSIYFVGIATGAENWVENFESHPDDQPILKAEAWKGYEGLKGDSIPIALVKAGVGINGSKALSISGKEEFRGDNYGLRVTLPEAYEDGVVWIQARIKQPSDWKCGLFMDLRGPERGQILARIAGSPYEHESFEGKKLRLHTTWSVPHWRLYTLGKLDTEAWQTVTVRLDIDAKSYAAWLDDMSLGDEMRFAADSAFTQIHLAFCGSPESPALVDSLTVGRNAPDGIEAPDLLPEPEDDLVFRFAAVGDPQLGFGGYETDKVRFEMAVDQINRSGSELSMILGDMVHFNDNEEAYKDCAEIAGQLKRPYYIRGNHEVLELYQKYFHEKSDFAFAHKGVRFVVLDAIGNQAGLSDEQLAFVEKEFSAATEAKEDIILSLHVSPWQNNSKGRGKYNQIGEGRDRLRDLMKEHNGVLCMSGHLHTGLWGAKEEETQYLVLPGTALAKTGPVSWCVLDVYPDRIVVHKKPLFFAYEKEDTKSFNSGQKWVPYEERKARYPFTQQGPLTIDRRATVAKKRAAAVPPPKEPVDLQAARAKVDSLVSEGLDRNGVGPNPPISDDLFLRRSYLAIAGRVPTIAESRAFHDSGGDGKRDRLVADLLESEAYVSHYYNIWADILRLSAGLEKARPAAEAGYSLWLKDALRNNTPYDEFVRQMITASAPWWEDGAVGYFIRDRGMPLDAMSNTVRVFLGTRIECAQCHDHPFDKWTQKDFYEMAAFTYGVDSRLEDRLRRNYLHFFQWTRDKQEAEYQKMAGKADFPKFQSESQLASFSKSTNYDETLQRTGMDGAAFQTAANRGLEAWKAGQERYARLRPVLDSLYRPVLYTAATEIPQKLELPHVYQYTDAAPGDVIEPEPMFGPTVPELAYDDSRLEAFADWLTSEENPAFTKVIVNRLWKETFGYGIFEPVDELTDQTPVSNQQLLDYLQELMIDLDYDMKGFLQVVFSTDAWQRAAQVEPVIPGSLYHFPGPLLRRMSAEQVWDSVVALTIDEADEVRPRLPEQLGRLEFQRQLLARLESFERDEFIELLERLTAAVGENNAMRDSLREQMLVAQRAGDEELYAELRTTDYRYRRMSGHILWEIGWGKEGAIEREAARKTPTKLNTTLKVEVAREQGLTAAPIPELGDADESAKKSHRSYSTAIRGMARASELASPAPRGHFLRDFGQSDRVQIENSNNGASIPQALNLLNGPLSDGLANRFSVLGQEVAAADAPQEKVRLIFQGMLTREPTADEFQLALSEFERNPDAAPAGLIWALLNTRQFLFIR